MRLWACLAAALFALGPIAARATVVVDEPLAGLAKTATLVVRGTVVAQKVQWDEGHRLIVTRTFIRPTEALKGAPGRMLVVRQVGGAIGRLHLNVEGTARFQVGEDVVVFVERHPRVPGEFVLTSMAAAKFSVVATKAGLVARRSLAGLTLARMDRTGVVRPSALPPATPDELPFDEFVREVRTGTR